MALHSKKLYYRRSGVTYPIDLGTTTTDVGPDYISLRDGSTTVYAKLGDITDGSASYLRLRKAGVTKAILSKLMGWQWAVQAGGLALDTGISIAVDSSGNCYIAGDFSGTASFGATNLTSSGNRGIFVAKLNTSGAWQWAVQVVGASTNMGNSIAVDSSGNCYVTGRFYNTASFGATSLTSSESYDIFVAKLNTSGAWQWAVQAGGLAPDQGYSIAVDSSGNCYITGYFSGTASFGATNLTSSGSYDIFVAKLNTSGAWQWAVRAGGGSYDQGNSIAVDSSGNCYIAGDFYNTASFGATNLTSSGNSDIFVAKLNTSGAWQWAVQAGGASTDTGNSIAVDSSGNCYIIGYFSETASFGATNLTSSGNNDIFVAKLNTSGAWQWAVQVGGVSTDAGNSIAVDSSGNCYIIGYFYGTASFGATNLTSSGSYDIFVAKLNTSGAWQWAVQAGGLASEQGNSIAVDSSGNCYIIGYFYETASFGATNLTSSGNYDIFVAKYGV